MCVQWTRSVLTPTHVVLATRPGPRLQSTVLRAGMSLAPPRGWAGQTRASSAASPCECRRSPGCRCPHALSMSLCKDSLMTLVTRSFGSDLLASGVLISWHGWRLVGGLGVHRLTDLAPGLLYSQPSSHQRSPHEGLPLLDEGCLLVLREERSYPAPRSASRRIFPPFFIHN